jgi:hypothetical protein
MLWAKDAAGKAHASAQPIAVKDMRDFAKLGAASP